VPVTGVVRPGIAQPDDQPALVGHVLLASAPRC
jgi:hypothetical protein